MLDDGWFFASEASQVARKAFLEWVTSAVITTRWIPSFMLSCCPAGLIDLLLFVCFKEFRNSISIDHSVPSLSYRTLLIHNPSYRGCFRTQDILFIGNYQISFSTKTKQSAASFEYKNNASITPSKYCPIRRRRITVLLTVGCTG